MNLTLTIPIPHKATHPNSRCHWAVKAKHAKKQRSDAFMVARGVIRKMAQEFGRFNSFKSASTVAVFYYRTKHSRDIDNCTSWLKSTYDGIADAGVVENDKCFVSHTVSIEYDKTNPRVEITITPL